MAASFLLVFSPPAGAVLSQAEEQQLRTQIELAGKLAAFAGDVQSTIERSAFDLDVLLDRLDYDAENIVAFVADSVGFEQYPGVLRGPQGTLMSRGGNSIDQSLLLAKLLRDAGYDARIAHGQLSEADAKRLLLELQRPRLPEPPMADESRFVQAHVKHALVRLDQSEKLESLKQSAHSRPPLPDDGIVEEVRSATEHILSSLEEWKLGVGRAESDLLLEEARDYYWVEYREAAADPWQSLHPAFGRQAPPSRIEVQEFHAGAIPADAQHRFRYQMFIERMRLGRLEVIPVSAPWERPVANMVSAPITLGVVTDTMVDGSGYGLDMASALAAAEYFMPVVGRAPPAGALFFDLMGNTLDPFVAGSAAAGVFRQVGSGFAKAAKGLSGGKVPQTLTAYWIDYTLISPGGEERTYRRTSFDRIGPAARSSGELPPLADISIEDAFPLLQKTTLMLSTGRTPRGLALDTMLDHFQRVGPAISTLTKLIVDPDSAGPVMPDEALPVDWPGHQPLFTQFDYVDTVIGSHRIYRSGPALVLYRSGSAGPGVTETAVDIVTNPRRAITLKGEPRADPAGVVGAGVWETAFESLVLNPGDRRISAITSLWAAQQEGRPVEVLGPGSRLGELSIPADWRAHLNADLLKGNAVLLPRPSSEERFGWWRVDLRTGDTLGQLSDGRGSAISEFLVTHSHAYSLAFLAIGLGGCLKEQQATGDDLQAACCVMSNLAFYGIGYLGSQLVLNSFPSIVYIGAEQQALMHLATLSGAWDIASSNMSLCSRIGG